MKNIVLGHKVSWRGSEVDYAKMEVIENLPPLVSMRGMCRFFRKDWFYKDSLNTSPKSPQPYADKWKRGKIWLEYWLCKQF